MKKLLTLLFTISGLSIAFGADVRIVSNVRVDLQPVHDWYENRDGERPMKHWKQIAIVDFTPSGPWPLCTLCGEVSKTVYLKNLPGPVIQYWSQVGNLKTRIGNLENQISDDKKRLRIAQANYAEYGSEYDQSRDRFAANIRNNEDDLDRLKDQLSELQNKSRDAISEFAMFTGQVYSGKEVWDCGLKTQ